MLLLLLTLWPIGLMLLWRRKLRWSVATKLLTSIVTLAACIVLIGFALTVNTQNPDYTRIQDNVNNFLDQSADTLIHLGGIVRERSEVALQGAEELAAVIREQESLRLADAIDWSVAQGNHLRELTKGLFDSHSASEGEQASATPTPESSVSPSPTVAATPTPRPVVEVEVHSSDETLPVILPAASADASGGQPIVSGILSRLGALESGPLPTPKPTPQPTEFTVKPAADAIVYYNDSGKYYHMTTVCGSMKSAHEHRFAEVVDSGHLPCNSCASPQKELLDEPYIVWVDDEHTAHLSDTCAQFHGKWQLMRAEDAIAANSTGCTTCGADNYLQALAAGRTIMVVAPTASAAPESTPVAESTATVEPSATASPAPTNTPTPTPTSAPSPTPSPEPEVITPKATLKPAGEAIVYHSSNGSWYHSYNRCSGMTGGDGYKLAECIEDYKCCKTCNAPEPDLVEKSCLWQDEDGLCHVSDECSAFKGQYHLIARDDALAQNLTGCTVCGGDEYLIANTIIENDTNAATA